MKVTGYKIKEAIKAFERLRDDFVPTAVAVPLSHEDRSNLVAAAEKFNRDFQTNQILLSDIYALKRLQLSYNANVKVDGEQTLSDVIQETSRIAQLASMLSSATSATATAETGAAANRDLLNADAFNPKGRNPRYAEPALEKTVLQQALRKFRSDETRLKNLVGYGNSVELEMNVDETLFDENRWTNFDAEAEIIKVANVYTLLDGRVKLADGLVLDPARMEKFAFDESKSVLNK